MKKLNVLKEIMIVLLSILLISALVTNVLATNPIDPAEFQNAQEVPQDTTPLVEENLVIGTNPDTNQNTKTNLPQTGTSDYLVEILLLVGLATAVFTYKKVQDYKNV